MNHIISVVTAVDPVRAEHLAETWSALRAQELPRDGSGNGLFNATAETPVRNER